MQHELNVLKEYLHYNPDTGDFIWVKSPAYFLQTGNIAGHISKSTGYSIVKLKGIKYKAHKLAWLFSYGTWPKSKIDHIDCIKHNNILSNLREVTDSQSSCNIKRNSLNSSGVKNIGWHKGSNRWRVRIAVKGKPAYCGYFSSLEEAEKIAIAKRIELHGEYVNHG
jgi:hypothetical protein